MFILDQRQEKSSKNCDKQNATPKIVIIQTTNETNNQKQQEPRKDTTKLYTYSSKYIAMLRKEYGVPNGGKANVQMKAQ